MPKRTYQPKKRRRMRVHGFRSRSSTSDGRAILSGGASRAVIIYPSDTGARYLIICLMVLKSATQQFTHQPIH